MGSILLQIHGWREPLPARRTRSSPGHAEMALEYRQRGELVIEAELPDLGAEEMAIWVADGVLFVRAARAAGPRPGDHVNDLRGGGFARDITLPPGAGAVRARYVGGRLEVRIALTGANRVPAGAVRIRAGARSPLPR